MVARSLKRRLSQLLAFTCASCALGQGVAAHPHVRISVETVFVVENGAIALLKHKWTFDEEFRRSNFFEFDNDQDGVLDEKELAAFQQLALDTLKRFESFTVLRRGTTKISIGEPFAVRFDMQAARPTYEFSVAPVAPVPVLPDGVVIEVYDPTYFSAFDFTTAQALSIEAQDGSGCTTALAAPARDSQQMKDYRAFVATFGPLSAKLVTPRTIRLTCRSLMPN